MESKNDIQEKLGAQVDEMKQHIEDLKVKAAESAGDLKEKYNEQIKELEPKIEEGKAKLKELADSTGEAWEEIKDGAESIWGQMKNTFSKVKEAFDKDDDEGKGGEEEKA